MRESITDLNRVGVHAEIRTWNLLNTSKTRYSSGKLLGITVFRFTRVCNACSL